MTITNEQIRAAAEEIAEKAGIAKFIANFGSDKREQLITEIAAIISRALSASVPEQLLALSGQCDNGAHQSCPYPDKCKCLCHTPEQSPRVCVKCGDHEPLADSKGCKNISGFKGISGMQPIYCGCHCSFPASVADGGVEALRQEMDGPLHSVCTFKLERGDRVYSPRTATICELLEDVRVIIKETPESLTPATGEEK